jgi:hypothetical protein
MRTIQLRLPRCSSTLPVEVDLDGSAEASLGVLWSQHQRPPPPQTKSSKQKEADHASLDLTRFRFVVSATETTPGMIISSNVPLHTTAVGTANVLEMWQVPDVMTVRLHAWSAGSEDKPTVIDYACPLLHMLPVIRRRFASQLAPGNAPVVCDELVDDAVVPSSPPLSPRNHSPPPPAATSSSVSSTATTASATASAANGSGAMIGAGSGESIPLLGTLRGASKRSKQAAALLPEVTFRLIEGGANGQSFWLSTAHSLVEQGCAPTNAKAILEVHCVRPELLRLPKQVDAHRIVMRGPLTVRAFGRNEAPLGKERNYWCILIDFFLFLLKKADKAAESVVLLEYHTVNLDAKDAAAPIELRRQHQVYSPSATHSYQLVCPNAAEKRRWYESIAKKCLSGATRVFGVALADVVARDRAAVPAIVQRCVDYLRVGTRLNSEGLFRKTGFRAVLEFARDLFDAGGAVDLEQVPRVDEIAVAALLKMYFAELPEPLIPFALYEGVVATEGAPDRVVSFVKAELPTLQLEVLYSVCRLLKETASRANHNKMTAKSLGIIWGPTLLRQRHGDLSNERLVADVTNCSRVCQSLIERADQLEPSLERRTMYASTVAAVHVDWETTSSTTHRDSGASDAFDLARPSGVGAASQPAVGRATLATAAASPAAPPVLAAAAKAKAQTMRAPENPYSPLPNFDQAPPASSPPLVYGSLPPRRAPEPPYVVLQLRDEETNRASTGSDKIDFTDLDAMAE